MNATSNQLPAGVDPLLTYPQAAKVLGVTERTIWTYVQQGELPAFRFGDSVRIDPADLRAFIDNAKRIEESDSASSNHAEAGGGQ